MKTSIFQSKSAILIALTVILIGTSCIPQKRLRYLQLQDALAETDTLHAQIPEHIIKPFDIIQVQVFSSTGNLISTPGLDSRTTPGTSASIYLQGYLVDKNGEINIPILGNHKVDGLTIPKLQSMLTDVAREKIALDADVNVRLVNFRVTVIGEVEHPGVIEVYNQRISIIEALAYTGDLTNYGNRKEILLIRENNGVNEIYSINLTDRNLLKSPYFYLQSNDIIYVQSLNAKSYGFAQVQWGIIISSVSTLIAIIAVVTR